MKTEKKQENINNEKQSGDNEDSESLEEQPLDIGEHYLIRRSDDSWRKFQNIYLTCAINNLVIGLPADGFVASVIYY